jgi:hypothetical protein
VKLTVSAINRLWAIINDHSSISHARASINARVLACWRFSHFSFALQKARITLGRVPGQCGSKSACNATDVPYNYIHSLTEASSAPVSWIASNVLKLYVDFVKKRIRHNRRFSKRSVSLLIFRTLSEQATTALDSMLQIKLKKHTLWSRPTCRLYTLLSCRKQCRFIQVEANCVHQSWNRVTIFDPRPDPDWSINNTASSLLPFEKLHVHATT